MIINADDWGGWRTATDAALGCHQQGRITCVSAMVFMDDSERAAGLAREHGVDVGLHINFSQPFTGNADTVPGLVEAHRRIMRFLRSSKYALLLYHPLLRKRFRFVFQAQQDEFVRLYGRRPSHYDGHQHLHLCTNMLLDGILPEGERVRRSFSFSPGEKSTFNRAYRRWVDCRLATRHRLTDYFSCIGDCIRRDRLRTVRSLARVENVELMTHPERESERAFLMGDGFQIVLDGMCQGDYATL